MNMKSTMKGLLYALSFALISPAFALHPAPVPCPSLQFVRTLIPGVNAVQIVLKHEYAVYTSLEFYESGSRLRWQLGTDVNTSDFNTAFEIGSKRIQNTAIQVDTYAEYLQDFWLCLFSDENNAPVYLVSRINKNDKYFWEKLSQRLV